MIPSEEQTPKSEWTGPHILKGIFSLERSGIPYMVMDYRSTYDDYWLIIDIGPSASVEDQAMAAVIKAGYAKGELLWIFVKDNVAISIYIGDSYYRQQSRFSRAQSLL